VGAAALATLVGLVYLTLLVGSGMASAAVTLQPVGNFASPIYMTAPKGDPRLFVVERAGTISVFKNGVASQFLDISSIVDSTNGERGLLSIAFDPNYASNGLFYIFFNDNGTGGGNAGQVWTIPHPNTIHNGGQLQFGPDGFLYISVGEDGTGANAQATGNALGKLLRIDPHGAGPGLHSVPASNPYVGQPGAVQEIYSLGLRNPWRFSFDHLTGDIAIGDVGAGTREEIDFATLASGLGKSANYGWPSCEGFFGSCAGFTPPVFDYPRSGAPCNAITGGFVYRGSQVPELAGRYVYADLCDGNLRSIRLALPLASEDRSEGAPSLGNPTSFGEDANCELYVTNGANLVSKIVSTGPPATAPVCATAAVTKKCKKRKHRKKRKHHSAATAKHKKHKKHKKKRCKRKRKKHKKRKK
jgi:glucose/arabinose dehydrogenase